ncbi:MAG: sel1 repeat family protein [Proteobacteria bacterium]|nr:sel1 repeat family protein [Pseudomonadota bacterium]
MHYYLNRGRAASLVRVAIERHESGDGRGALDTFRRAASLGNNQARYNLGVALLTGALVPLDVEQGLAWLRRAGFAGHRLSMRRLGSVYASGEGVSKDLVVSMMWFEQAAQRGDAPSQCALGLRYLEGTGIPIDDQKAVRWLREAAEQNEPTACSTLGACFENGRGVPQDPAQALGWQLRAAQLGNAIGQYNAGRHYLSGVGTPVNATAAVTWFSKAAEAGDADAQFNLGRCCMRGLGLAEDPMQAVRWFEAAAAQGHALAKVYLAGHLADGTTGPPDRARSLKLLDEAEVAGMDVHRARSAILKASTQTDVDFPEGMRKAVLARTIDDVDGDAEEVADLQAILDQPTPFRRSCCLFAFHLLPEWLFNAHRSGSLVTAAEIRARVLALWPDAVRSEHALGVYVSTINQPPTCRDVQGWIVVEMPVHGLPPEPRYMLIDVTAVPARVLLVESFLTRDARGLLCSIDMERHAVHGVLSNRTLATALEVCSTHHPLPSLQPADGLVLIRQATLYAETHADLQRVRGAA